ncbi:regucalcin-like isoform X2 [Sitodiplosis mosellana]|uniref:regucalcin-like isoform X2 n=1 Tax=Sitodiplosis mosellana TaxID=263140 RepID=UPI002443927F|nr:regucalcin-like isoform X2 [Sitodiplosis mosellana]
MSQVKIEQLPSPRSLCGEGPHWDVATQSLYYIDIEGPESTILRYDYKENKTYPATVDNVPLMTFVLPIENSTDEFLVGSDTIAKVIRWDGKSSKGQYVRDAFAVESGDYYSTNRFNDAKCDPVGRFFGGTQRYNECKGPFNVATASLYRYDRQIGVKHLKGNVFISNGLTWVANKFYYIDSCAHDLKEFDYNIETGDISNERTMFLNRVDGKTPDFVLDGMTSDVEGNLYIATYNGHKVFKLNPKTSEVLAEYVFPNVSKITSVAFGGPNLDILYATTATRGDTQDEAGHLYKITGLGTKGSAGVKVKL